MATVLAQESALKKDESDLSAIGKKLEEFEKDLVGVQELTVDGGPTLRKQIIRYYQTQTNGFPAKSKIVVSRCMAIEQDFKGASRLAAEYLKSYPNDFLGYRILGGANRMLGDHQRALYAYTNAIMLGDEASYTGLAGEAILLDRLDLVRDIVPHLLVLKDVERTSPNTKIEIIGLLAVYAQKSQRNGVLESAIRGANLEDLLERQDVAQVICRSCRELKLDQANDFCRKLIERLELGAMETNSVHSNSPPGKKVTPKLKGS